MTTSFSPHLALLTAIAVFGPVPAAWSQNAWNQQQQFQQMLQQQRQVQQVLQNIQNQQQMIQNL